MSSLTSSRTRVAALLLVVFLLLLIFGGNGGSGFYSTKGLEEVFNSTLGFQKIFVVNLPERTDRRDAMSLMAALTGLKFTYVAGVHGEIVPERVLPSGEKQKNVKSPGKIGNWRAHMNVMERVVRENLTSALILEDDLDWDIRLKQTLQKIALATQKYTQPQNWGFPSLADQHLYSPHEVVGTLHHAVNIHSAPSTVRPKLSPYGDNWDILWLGHTGGDMPSDFQSVLANHDYPPHSLLTLYIPDDDSVPAQRHLKRHPFADVIDRFGDVFPPHTRVVHEARAFGGAQAYAVSQKGARKLLLKFGIETLTDMWDICMRDFCEGVYHDEEKGDERPVCVATNPPLMSQYWGGWGGSDLQNIGGGYFHKTGSISIRYSVRLNMKRLLARKGTSDTVEGLVDQWPDHGNGPW